MHDLTRGVFNTIGYDESLPNVYMQEGYHINSFTLKDKEAYYVVLSTGAIDRLSREELMFLVGHEAGHIISGHIEFQLLLAFLPESARGALRIAELANKGIKVGFEKMKDAKDFLFGKKGDEANTKTDYERTGIGADIRKITGVADGATRLNKWNRISEYTADRIGLLACQDINVALCALMKISGLPQTYYNRASIAEFLDQVNEFDERYGNAYDSIIKELDMLDEDHPWLIRRAAELLKWYKSGAYERTLNPKGGKVVRKSQT